MKKFIFYNICCIIFLICSAMTCGDTGYSYVTVVNFADEDICVSFRQSHGKWIINPQYMWFEIPEKECYEIPMDSTLSFEIMYGNVSDSKQKCQFLIYKKSTLEKYSKEDLVKYDIFDKRYIISFDDLGAKHNRIIYTGE